MKRAGTGGTLAVVAVVLMMTLSGCAGWGASPDGGVVEGANEPDAGNEADAEGDGASTTGADATVEDDASPDASRTSDSEPPDENGSVNDADDGAVDGGDGADVDEDTGTSDADESGASDGGSVDEDETTNVTDDGTPNATDDGTTDNATVDDGEADPEDGTQSDDGTVEADDGEGDGETTDEPVQEYDSSQFTFTAIAYGDDEERPPHSVDVWNTHGRSIDLSGWTVTTTEDGEYVFPEGTTVGSDGTVMVQFGPGELTRDGGTLTLIDARGNVVIEDEYGD